MTVVVRIAYYAPMSKNKIKLAIYGGAFDPPHIGHADAIRQASLMADRLLVIPSFKHPSGKVMASFEQRCFMVGTMVDSLRGEGIDVSMSRAEKDLHKEISGPIYSLLLLEHIARKENLHYSDVALVIGEDNLKNLHKFWRYHELVDKFRVMTVKEIETIHSTQIREKARRKENISRYLLGQETVSTVYALYATLEGDCRYGL